MWGLHPVNRGGIDMRRTLAVLLSLSAIMPAVSLAQTAPSLADQKLAAEIEKLRAETEKIGVDTGKSRVDADNAALDALRKVPNATASMSEAGKTAELTLLRRALATGAAAKLAGVTGNAIQASASVQPKVIVGSTPPTIDQWLWFQDHRERVQDKLVKANDAWRAATASMQSLVAVSGALALAATVLPMLKTDTSMTGIEGKLEADELLHVMYAALAAKGFGVDDSELQIANYVTARDELLRPLAQAHLLAKANLKDFEEDSSPTPRQQKVAEALRAAIAAYDTLKSALETPASGRIPAVAMLRERDFANGMAARPLVYLTGARLGMTAMTKKGFFTGMFGDVPAYSYGTAIFDYALVTHGAPAKRGTVSCTVARRKTEELLKIKADKLAEIGATMCEVEPKLALPGGS